MLLKLKEFEVPQRIKELLAHEGAINIRGYESKGGLSILYSEDAHPRWGRLKHCSVSRPDRNPTWDEILEVKEQLFGDIDAMMVMPKSADYVNLHKFCFHVWQIPEEWGIQ